ncbi:MAG TPA: MBG domain-containing protein, partial [Vicinamibacterales bacterium]|nr:MBG domain-containing protein [Vicinamibacterales bacterium]
MPDSQSGTWVATGNLAGARDGAAAALLPSGVVLVTGGADETGSVASVELFGPDGTFGAAAAMIEARADHAAVVLKDGRVLVVGGRNATGAVGGAEVFASGSWASASGLTDARWGHTATVLADGRVLVAGGENASGAVMSLELFDPETGVFAVAGSLAAPRRRHAATLLQDGRVLIAGGSTGEAVLASTEVFSPATLQLSAGPSLNTAREGLSATTLLDGRVVFIGGHSGTSNVASAEIFSAVSSAITYTATTTPMVARRGHQAFRLPNNNAVLIVGGIAEEVINGVVVEQATSAAELYLPWLNEVWQTGGMTVARSQASGAALSAESYGAAPAGEGLAMIAGGAGVSSSEAYRFATIRTEKNDYAPGDIVHVSGSGWQPNEAVTFGVRELPAEHEARSFTIVADANGRIASAELFTVEPHHLNVTFFLTARGAASQAQVTFTDGNIKVTSSGGLHFNFTSTLHPGSTDCSGTPDPLKNHTGDANGATVGVGNSQSILIVANQNANAPNASAAFSHWSAPGSPAIALASGYSLTDRTICVVGFQSGSRDLIGHYQVAAATSLVVGPATGTYGDTATLTATLTSGSPATGVSGKTIAFTLNGSAVGEATTNASGVATLVASLTGINAGTYLAGTNSGVGATFAGDIGFVTSTASSTLTVTPRAITVTVDAKSKPYGDADPALTYQITSGSLVGDDAFTGSLARAAGEEVGTYAIQQGTLSLDASYTLTIVGANLTITARAVTVTADAGQTKVYGTTDPELTYTLTTGTLAEGDTFTGALTRATGESVGTYAIQQGTLALDSNYNLTFIGANFTITARPITVTADVQTKIYGEADPTLTHQITSGSLAFSDVFTGTLTRDAGEAVGSYAITQGTLAAGGNYVLTFVGANLTITARPITVTADVQAKVYGEADPALTYQVTLGSLVTGDAFTGALTRVAGEAVGSYAVTQGTLALDSNYNLTFIGANLTITARPITVTAHGQTKVYGEADPALTFQVTSGSLVFSDVFAGALGRGAGEDVGTYAITQGTLALSSNYDLTFVGANLTITVRPITVTA